MDYARQENMEYEQLAALIHGYHAAVGELLTCKREPGIECCRYALWQCDLLHTKKVVMYLPQVSYLS